ncbi:protein-methionine-sulfoxide reductase catalytic subunit MsrP [Varunaivibrio sulfuroxidans]|uniref:Protein-methionine-sulfoxide reductase catalytic subunit MsrP n=1 Tax=Varunaivibrio sulfuroxidans TaxID=1773489 RepID=A0A4R3J5V3_9PROT|nr:protein-methionine-sulfoxide reductase catalytic subunit MsrP [Varunaivibrio sulfuroxidans]TCS60654.1 sulfoxide reductase catalytic subunit YedY [Varunaivibrio sulfuroxidans]WES30145.1 protein-methionine-sulfoxide reductase catalytic subunit MsrP [Varunaivibrio sulfuroxidans]
MLITIRKPSDAKEVEVTPQVLFESRRRFIKTAALGVAGGAVAFTLPGAPDARAVVTAGNGEKLAGIVDGPYATTEKLTPYKDVTTYNNFYEFGTSKSDPAENAKNFITRPWTVSIEGEVAKPGVVDVEDLIRSHQLEERIYRHRCVEAWSMVVPWVGVPLSAILKRVEPTSNAKFVAFETLYDPKRMPGQNRSVLDWPYVEGLRLDEAMNPLAILAVGVYGERMPAQNGAPIRLVTPWKYGFKGIKSIVKIRLVRDMPPTTWNKSAAREYGFYANVNPRVDHPRWSQAKERRIGEFFRRKTLMFNGYGAEVADMYRTMDLSKNF